MSSAAVTLATTNNAGGGLPITWILLAILAIFWIFLLMQNRKRRAAQLEQRNSIAPGSKVLLTSGFIGTLLSKDGDQAEVELADGFTVRVLASAIARTLPDHLDADASAADPDAVDTADTEAVGADAVDADKVTDATPNSIDAPSTSTATADSAITDGNGRTTRD